MKLSKTLDKIAIALSILAVFPGGFIGLAVMYHLLHDVSPADGTSLSQADIPLVWWKVVVYIIGSVFSAVSSFFIVLFGIRRVISVVKKVSAWMIEAASKEEEK